MFDLLKPSNTGIDIETAKDFGNLGGIIDIHTSTNQPDIKRADIIIIGIPDESNAIENEGTAHAPEQIRKALYRLFPGNWQLHIADLGNIIVDGDSSHQTYKNLSSVLSYLPADVNVVLLGGSQDSTLALTNYLDLGNKTYNLSVIDAIIDSSFADDDLDNENYLSHILTKDSAKLQNLNILGIQSYYNHPSKFEIFDKLFIDYYKLGEMQNNILECEPELRESNIVSIDVRSIRQCDMPAQSDGHPNGLTGLDVCKLTRLTGIAVKNKFFGIYEYNPLYDKNNTGANLIAQMIWYYIEGKNDYKTDYPNVSKKQLLKFYVESDIMKLIFYKNPKTNRWWVSLPELVDENNLFACSESDYHNALNSNLTTRILRMIKKVTL